MVNDIIIASRKVLKETHLYKCVTVTGPCVFRFDALPLTMKHTARKHATGVKLMQYLSLLLELVQDGKKSVLLLDGGCEFTGERCACSKEVVESSW